MAVRVVRIGKVIGDLFHEVRHESWIVFSGSSQIHHLVLLELILAHQYNLLNRGGLVFLLFLLFPGGLRALSTEAWEVLTKRMKYPKKWVSVLVCKCKS